MTDVYMQEMNEQVSKLKVGMFYAEKRAQLRSAR